MNQDKLDYFILRTDERLKSMEHKIDRLIGFRWMLIGMASAISAVVSIIISAYFGR